MRRPTLWQLRAHLLAAVLTASSLGGDASSRRHCQLGGRYPKLAILLLVMLMYLLVKASSLDKQMPTRGRVAPWWGRVPYARVHNIYLETFFVPCSIFITQCIDNQYFQEMKHWHSMFHFWFQCFSGVSPIGVLFLSHWGFKSLPLGFDFSSSVFFGKVCGK